MNALLKRLLPLLVASLFGTLGTGSAQSVWATAVGGLPPLRGTFSVGVGLTLPLGVATIGLELTPFGWSAVGNIRGLGLVVRNVGLPFTPISLRGEAGLEQIGPNGNFDGAPLLVYLGGGVRYALAGPVGLTAGARTYLVPSVGASVLLGLDVAF